MRRHDQPRGYPPIPDQLINVAEVFGVREFYTDFLMGFSRGGESCRIVVALHPPAGKGHMARPRVAFKNRPLDEQHFSGFRAFPQDHSDRGPLMASRIDGFGSVSGQLVSHVSNIHVRQLSGPIGRDRFGICPHSG